MANVYFPQFRKGRQGFPLRKDKTLLDHAREAGVEIHSECGGRGECGKCIVRVDKGRSDLPPITEVERNFGLKGDLRLACQAVVTGDEEDLYVYIEEFGAYSILTETHRRTVPLEPFVHREGDKVFYDGRAIDSYRGGIYGLAVDVGTTTLVLEVVDLETGGSLGVAARKNPQVSYGNDVISRIEYTMVDREKVKYLEPADRQTRVRELQEAVVRAIGEQIHRLEEEREEALSPCIYEVVAVGNSTMRNLFFGIDVSSLGLIPYEPLKKEAFLVPAEHLGFALNPNAQAYAPPLIGGHAGADAVADILTVDMHKGDDTVMVIDVGTNGEVAIGNRHRILTASCAAGGAYEGASVGCGLGAIEGAISNLRVKETKVEFSTIGGKAPKGICGSGLIDLLAELLRTGIMDGRAKIKAPFLIDDGIELYQEDIYQLITAKAGLKTDQELLMKYYGATPDEVQRVYLSGAFGNYVNLENAISIGLLPPMPEKIVKIGNGALEGAREMLVNRTRRREAEELLTLITHTKPNEMEEDFAYLVAENMYFRG